MKHLLALLLMLPATALAQDPVAVADGPSAVEASQTAQRQPPPAPPPAEPEARRRPSMVGYIGDSSISTKVRIRYDAGYGINAADRAEFFYAKCGCYRTLPSTDPAYDPNAAGPGPGVLTNMNFGQLYLLAEYAGRSWFSAYAELPIRFLRPDTFAPGTGSFGSQNGLSDLRLGGKVGLVSRPERQVTAALQVGVPTGDSRKGLGTGHGTIEPMLLYAERPTDRFAIEAQLGDVIPVSGSDGVPVTSDKKFSGAVVYYGVGPSYAVYRTPQLAIVPVVELVGWHVVSGYQTANRVTAAGTNIVNLKFGARFLFQNTSSFYVGYGHALTTAVWYDDIVRFEYRVALGR